MTTSGRTCTSAGSRDRSIRRVLVTDGGNGQSRSTLAAVRALHAGGYSPIVTVSDEISLAARSRYCMGTVPVPPVDRADYGETVRAELSRQPYVAMLPCSDAALVALGAPGGHLVDKTQLMGRVASAGLPVLQQRVFDSAEALLDAAGELDYPLVVKVTVRATGGQPPTVRAESPAQLAPIAGAAGSLLVQPYVNAPMCALSGVLWQGSPVAAVQQRYLRIFPVSSGVASYAVTSMVDDDLADRVATALTGYDGVFQAQFVGPYLVDVNPRVYGSLPLAVAAGANLPACYCDLLRGRAVARIRARPGVAYRWVEGDVRHLAVRWRADELTLRECATALWPRRGTAHSTESLCDPGPAVARLRHSARKWRHG